MPGNADANLVMAAITPQDGLHARARRHLHTHGRLRVPFSVSAELFLLLHRRGVPYQEFLAEMEDLFDVDSKELLQLAAQALDTKVLKTPMDALHAADSWSRGESLHTADQELLTSMFPTTPF